MRVQLLFPWMAEEITESADCPYCGEEADKDNPDLEGYIEEGGLQPWFRWGPVEADNPALSRECYCCQAVELVWHPTT